MYTLPKIYFAVSFFLDLLDPNSMNSFLSTLFSVLEGKTNVILMLIAVGLPW